MKHLLLLVTALVLLGELASALAGPKEDVAAATKAWADAFNSRDPEKVLVLYDAEAVLWGTVSPTLRDTPDAIRDYFKGMPNQPQARVELGEQRIRMLTVKPPLIRGCTLCQMCVMANQSRRLRASALPIVCVMGVG